MLIFEGRSSKPVSSETENQPPISEFENNFKKLYEGQNKQRGLINQEKEKGEERKG
jgi:hypothetical protein